jgi:hypothetical protein
VLLLSPKFSSGVFLTRDECKHTNSKYEEPAVVRAFKKSKYYASGDVKNNDLVAHHKLVELFCKERLSKRGQRRCSWQDYYLVLDELRLPFLQLYDPGMVRTAEHLEDIQKEAKSGSKYQKSCEVIESPTAEKLYDYVVGNKPVIIKGEGDKWPAVKKWTDKYLKQVAGNKQVIV